MHMDVWTETLRLTRPLRISRSETTCVDNVFVAITADGHTGFGEAAPGPWRGESLGAIEDYLNRATTMLGTDPFAGRAILARLDAQLPTVRAARSAVDMALADLVGKILGQPLYRLLGVDPQQTCELCFTVSLDDDVDSMVAAAADAAAKYRALKIKLGGPRDADIVREIAAAVDVPLRVDANGGWTADHTLRLVEDVLAPCGVALLEQPVAATDLGGLTQVHAHSSIPVIADESITDLTSLRPLIDRCAGIDIKLTKCGGVIEALDLIGAARAVGMTIMIGCEVETSLAVTAAASLTPLADYADLDLHLWLDNDPYDGVLLEEGRFVLPARPGLGCLTTSRQSLRTRTGSAGAPR